MAVILAAGGGAYAATNGAGTITACVHHHGGGLYRTRKCARHVGQLSWDIRGATGDPAPTGAHRPTGNTGATSVPGPTGRAALSNIQYSGPNGIGSFPVDSAYDAVTAITIPAGSSGTYLVEANGQLATGSTTEGDKRQLPLHHPAGDGLRQVEPTHRAIPRLICCRRPKPWPARSVGPKWLALADESPPSWKPEPIMSPLVIRL